VEAEAAYRWAVKADPNYPPAWHSPCGVLEIEVGGAWPPQPGEGRRSGGVIALPMMRSSNAAVRVTTVASVIIGRASRWELAKGGQVFEAKTWSCRNRIR
jgi:hypothetical protein